MSKGTKMVRVSKEFDQFVSNYRKNIQKETGFEIPYTEATKKIASDIKSQQLLSSKNETGIFR